MLTPTPHAADRHRANPADAVRFSTLLAAAAMIAFQVAGKAARDSIFLSHYSVGALPVMYSGSAAVALLMALAMGRAMQRHSPAALVPKTYLASSAIMLVEWVLLHSHPRLAAAMIYIHVTVIGGLLISGFWSVINELYDPRSGKRAVGRLAVSATAGGLLGGLLAERLAAWFAIEWSLPLLAALHVACSLGMKPLEQSQAPAGLPTSIAPGSSEDSPAAAVNAWQVIRSTPYLFNLGLLVCLGTVASALVDYVFLVRASEKFGGGQTLMRYLAAFYTVVGFITFAVQALLSRKALEIAGLARSVAAWPAALAVGGTTALLAPGIATATLARSLGSVFNDTLFRSAYELLYTPIAPAQKRTAKAFLDTGASRLGDFLSGGIIRLVLFAAPALAVHLLLFVAVLLALVALWITARVGRGYITTLEENLLGHAIELDPADLHDSTTRSAVSHVLHSTGSISAAARSSSRVMPPQRLEQLPSTIAALRSRDKQRVMEALHDATSLDPALVPHVIPLLAWDDAYQEAILLLRRLAPQAEQQLIAHLTDADEPFAIRRRLPRVLSSHASPMVVSGLTRALEDSRFEVRYQAAIALDLIRIRDAALALPDEPALRAVQREISLGRRVWDSQRLLDNLDDVMQDFAEHDCAGHGFVDEVVRDRANRCLEHVFRLLSFIMPREPLRVAFRGLYTDDLQLRNTALEYLEITLPGEVCEALWPYLEAQRGESTPASSREEILDALMRSHESIELNLRQARQAHCEEHCSPNEAPPAARGANAPEPAGDN